MSPVSVAHHRAAVSRLVGPPVTISVPLDRHAVGRHLATDLVAADDVPRFDSSAMDGYAVRPVTPDQREFIVVADVAAGDSRDIALTRGEAARVMTGARVPEGAVGVVPVELTDASPTGPAPERVVAATVAAGSHVRRRGEDLSAGVTLARRGAAITPGLIALARSSGCADAVTYAAVRVAVVATGTELVEPGATPGAGGIHESNSDMVAALCLGAGCTVDHVTTCSDEPAAFRALLDDFCASPDIDLVVTTGGVSAGAHEVVRQVCEPLESFEFVRVAMQPGGPQGLGEHQGTPVVCLPGTPAGAFVAFYVLVRPALDRRHGAPTRESESAAYEGPPRTVRVGVVQFLTGVMLPDGAVHIPPDRHLRALAAANCLVEVPVDVVEVCQGDLVRVHPL